MARTTGTQTWLTARPGSNFAWDWTDIDDPWELVGHVVPAAAEDGAVGPGGADVHMAGSPSSSNQMVVDLRNEEVWGPVLADHLERVAEKYGRWHKTPMQKYEAAAWKVGTRFGGVGRFAGAWVRPGLAPESGPGNRFEDARAPLFIYC